MTSFVDLHTHTAFSREADNFLEIRLNDYARAKREMPLEVVSALDHDTLNYLEPLYRARKQFEPGKLPIIVPGIEITSAFAHPTRAGKLVQTHLLGYFPRLIDEDKQAIEEVNAAMEASMRKVLEGNQKKNFYHRLRYLFDNGIVQGRDFEELSSRILQKYQQDKAYVELKEPKKGDIINWPLNTSDKTVTDVLLDEGIIVSAEEGKLYVDRKSDEKAGRLAQIFVNARGLPEHVAREKAAKLQGSCHGDYNDDFYKISTQEAIALVLKAGGIPILAHPMVSLKSFKDGEDAFYSYCQKELVGCGLRGMEAFYPKQEPSAVLEFCRKNDLFVTGGSDDHQDGRNHIGEVKCPAEYVRAILH